MAESEATTSPLIEEEKVTKISYNTLSDTRALNRERFISNSKRNKVKTGVLCFLCFGLLVGPLLAIAILVPTSTDCFGIDENIRVYSNDTVTGQHLRSCQHAPRAYFLTTPNTVDVFAVDCRGILKRSETIEDGGCTIMEEESTIKVFLDATACPYSNYLLKGSAFEVQVDITQPTKNLLYVCVFADDEKFRVFENATDEDELVKVAASAEICNVIQPVNDTSALIFGYTTSQDAYHFGGIKSVDNVSAIEYTFGATRLYYDPSDYTQDRINCSSASTECNFNKTSPDTCVLLHADKSEGILDSFNVVKITADYNFHDWRFILSVSSCALLLSIILSLTCMSVIYILV